MRVYVVSKENIEEEEKIVLFICQLLLTYPLEVISGNMKPVYRYYPLPNIKFGDCVVCVN